MELLRDESELRCSDRLLLVVAGCQVEMPASAEKLQVLAAKEEWAADRQSQRERRRQRERERGLDKLQVAAHGSRAW